MKFEKGTAGFLPSNNFRGMLLGVTANFVRKRGVSYLLIVLAPPKLAVGSARQSLVKETGQLASRKSG